MISTRGLTKRFGALTAVDRQQIQTTEERIKLVYRIKIDADNPNQELKVNMPVDAELEGNS